MQRHAVARWRQEGLMDGEGGSEIVARKNKISRDTSRHSNWLCRTYPGAPAGGPRLPAGSSSTASPCPAGGLHEGITPRGCGARWPPRERWWLQGGYMSHKQK
jgi:hypothetical protein